MAEHPKTRKRAVLDLLLAAGDEGVSGSLLAIRCGHRFPARLSELRADGYFIDCQTVRDATGAVLSPERRYAIKSLPDGSRPLPTRFPTLDDERLSIRQAYRFIVSALRDGEDGLRAIQERLLRQPELIFNRSLRHNLGAKKRARLDELARAVGLATPPAMAEGEPSLHRSSASANYSAA